MNPQLLSYVKEARDKQVADDKIEAALVGSGWPAYEVKAALSTDPNLPVPPPPPPSSTAPGMAAASPETKPASMIMLPGTSTHGFDYTIMFLSLWIFAVCLGGILHNLVSSMFGSDSVGQPFYAAGLIVSLPILAFFFIRTKKHEVSNPESKKDPIRKKAVQLSMLVTFLVGVGHLVFYVYTLLNGDSAGASPIQNLLHMLVTLLVAGTIFVYYWIDEHRNEA